MARQSHPGKTNQAQLRIESPVSPRMADPTMRILIIDATL
jgi:hypothetical protein